MTPGILLSQSLDLDGCHKSRVASVVSAEVRVSVDDGSAC
jgi:hypothetical protein